MSDGSTSKELANMAKAKKKSATATLTPAQRKAREQAIIRDLKAGKLSYREIAAKHGVSLPTVNSKARKAGIVRPRGRRPKAGRPAAAARPAVSARRKAKAAKKVARKKARRKAATRRKVTRRTAVRKVRTVRRKATARKAARRKTARQSFQDAFRALLMAHFPDMSIKKFDQLLRLVERRVG
jgi:hypothetical protein